jgi:hypothetical protein
MNKSPENTTSDKRNRWQQEKEIVDRITDKLGLEIDEGIKDCVIALRLQGINTTSSHEGKIDRYPIPYVDIASPKGERLTEERSRLIDSLKSPEEKKLDEEVDRLWDKLQQIEDEESAEATETRKQIKQLESHYKDFDFPESLELVELTEKIIEENRNEHKKILVLLEEFYQNREVPDDVRLEAVSWALGTIRLQSKGAKLQEEEGDQEKRLGRLRQFQAEMNNFTDFLKQKFFSS